MILFYFLLISCFASLHAVDVTDYAQLLSEKIMSRKQMFSFEEVDTDSDASDIELLDPSTFDPDAEWEQIGIIQLDHNRIETITTNHVTPQCPQLLHSCIKIITLIGGTLLFSFLVAQNNAPHDLTNLCIIHQ